MKGIPQPLTRAQDSRVRLLGDSVEGRGPLVAAMWQRNARVVAIVVVGAAMFVAAGFNRVDVVTLERDELAQAAEGAPVARALARRLARLFESRAGPLMRFLMPFALLAGVYVAGACFGAEAGVGAAASPSGEAAP